MTRLGPRIPLEPALGADPEDKGSVSVTQKRALLPKHGSLKDFNKI